MAKVNPDLNHRLPKYFILDHNINLPVQLFRLKAGVPFSRAVGTYIKDENPTCIHPYLDDNSFSRSNSVWK